MKSESSRLHWLCLFVPILVFVVLRLPSVIHMPGAQDEQFFAVPGYTVWHTGVPAIPYLPSRRSGSFFENADRCMMALPPALFYLQAPFFAILPPGYPTARVPVLLGALVAIAICYMVARAMGAKPVYAGFAALLFAIGRPLLFTGIISRPDLWCAIFGWCAMLCIGKSTRHRALCWSSAAGACCGLAALFHPYALVFFIQSAVALVLLSRAWLDRFKRTALFALACGCVLSLWIPLIVQYPTEFRSQFFSNVLDRAGPGLPARMLWPFRSLANHAALILDFAGPAQTAAMVVSLLLATAILIRKLPPRQAIAYLFLMWSSIYLTAVVAGLHTMKTYWIYSWLWVMAPLGLVLQTCFEASRTGGPSHAMLPRGAMVAVVLAAFLFVANFIGSGLKTTYLYYRHWGQPRYHAGVFIADVLKDLPSEGLFLADTSYVFDIYLSGRQTLLCTDRKRLWGDQQFDYAAMLIASEGEDEGSGRLYGGELVKEFGTQTLPQECFVNYYRQSANPIADPGNVPAEIFTTPSP
jgi:4-amino-4-deoxy-L-arabinose transferase-like glycosyltransferase